MVRTKTGDSAERDSSARSLTPHQRLQLDLGSRLRQLRRSAQLTQIDMSRRLGVSQSTVSELETGRTTPNIVTLERIAEILELAPEARTDLTEQLAQLHAEISTWRVLYRRGHRWNQERIGGLEAQARVIRSYQMAVVPGLLQTADYARVIATLYDPSLPRIDDLIAGRLQRQQILYDRTKRFHFIIGEPVLRSRLVDQDVMRGQLDRLLVLSRLEHVEIGVLPIGAEAGALALTSFDDLDDVVAIEMDTSEIIVRDPQQVARYVEIFEGLRAAALYGESAIATLRTLESKLAS